MKAYCINLPERPERWDEFRKQKIPFEVQRFDAIRDNPGWKGCTKSHLKVFQEITEYPCIVFEDDCLMLHDWAMVEQCMIQLPADWDMLYLGATLNEKLEPYSKNLYRIKNAWTTHAIIYNSNKVPEFILSNKSNIKKIDVFITENVLPIFQCFITYPLIATQRPGISDVLRKSTFTDYKIITDNYEKYVK